MQNQNLDASSIAGCSIQEIGECTDLAYAFLTGDGGEMKSLMLKLGILAGATVLMVAFQNCSKIGTNGIAIEENSLSLDQVEIVDQPDVVVDLPDEEEPAAPVKDPVKEPGKEGGGETDDVEAEDDGGCKDVKDDEVAKAVAMCSNEGKTQGFVSDQEIKVVHGKADYNVDQVAKLSGVHSTVVLRAASADSKIVEARNVQGLVVLCGFAEVEGLDSVQGKVIVVGGRVREAKLVQSTLVLVNASLQSHTGVKSRVKTYSVK